MTKIEARQRPAPKSEKRSPGEVYGATDRSEKYVA